MYRTPDALATTEHLETELAQTRAELKSIEKELYAARHAIRRRGVQQTLAAVGYGALVGNILGGVMWGVTSNPVMLIAGPILCAVFGALIGGTWNKPDDNFPPAPPPRMY